MVSLDQSLSPEGRALWAEQGSRTIGDLKTLWDACCDRCGYLSCKCQVSTRTLQRRRAAERAA